MTSQADDIGQFISETLVEKERRSMRVARWCLIGIVALMLFVAGVLVAGACSLPGDGAGNGVPRSYSANGPVVVDNNTTLTWKQRSGVAVGDAMLLNDALTLIGHFNDVALGGITGWRLPSVMEAVTLLDFLIRWPAVDVPPFAGIVNQGTQGGPLAIDAFWTTASNLVVDEWGGGVGMPPSLQSFLRPVAGDAGGCLPPDHKAGVPYVVTADTVTDPITGLMWQRFNGDEQNIVTFNTEQTYVDAVNAAGLGGYHDWRVPNVIELYTIVDLDFTQPAIDQTIFGPTLGQLYWSKTQHTGSFTCGYGASFGIGMLFHDDRNRLHPVRLVRG